ncbi:hypothetical protein [Helicobacter suis]|uniref:hypothetical protein n=1 Tax=Helicobacter suis TaxID=104628 RepID=UPI0013D32140|nr:hypothetical protein [Helicobacter suis]
MDKSNAIATVRTIVNSAPSAPVENFDAKLKETTDQVLATYSAIRKMVYKQYKEAKTECEKWKKKVLENLFNTNLEIWAIHSDTHNELLDDLQGYAFFMENEIEQTLKTGWQEYDNKKNTKNYIKCLMKICENSAKTLQRYYKTMINSYHLWAQSVLKDLARLSPSPYDNHKESYEKCTRNIKKASQKKRSA